MSGERDKLLIVGASARAAAHSALRAGITPIAVDLFGDRDLAQVARVLPVRRWPGDVPALARTAPAGPWMYTGALENHPRIVAAVSSRRTLWGNPASVLRRVRDPFCLRDALLNATLPALELRTADDPPPSDGSWVLKPRRSAGGRGIQRWTAAAVPATRREPHFFQRYAEGTAISAVFVGHSSSTALVGISQQLVGLRLLSAGPFAYCGSIGPFNLPPTAARQVEHTGITLGSRFGLRGLFGIDFVLSEGAAWPVELNPRYTASVEVLEHANGIPLLDWHRRAFERDADLPNSPPEAAGRDNSGDRAASQSTSPASVAKAILYAPCDLHVTRLGPFVAADPIRSMPAYTDLPHDGARIRQGRPVCTVLAQATTRSDCLGLLDERLARLRSALGLAAAPPVSIEPGDCGEACGRSGPARRAGGL
ncbi:MAG TPA: ATP-grasp domain-containing protein [Planctomycetaceae bacterium]|nr:ATP-grasp domain-containing protein [Planctomycetaceae bacterium]